MLKKKQCFACVAIFLKLMLVGKAVETLLLKKVLIRETKMIGLTSMWEVLTVFIIKLKCVQLVQTLFSLAKCHIIQFFH